MTKKNWKGIGRPLRLALFGSGPLTEEVAALFDNDVTFFREAELDFAAMNASTVDGAVIVQSNPEDHTCLVVARVLRERLIGVALVVTPLGADLLKEHLGVIYKPGFAEALTDATSVAVQTTWVLQHARPSGHGRDERTADLQSDFESEQTDRVRTRSSKARPVSQH